MTYICQRSRSSNESSWWFSVIVPTLNEERNIGRLIASIHAQSYRPIEVVVADGGSRDKTVEIAKTLKKKAENLQFKIKILEYKEKSKKTRLKSENLNVGIVNSMGRYILPLDADTELIDVDLLKKLSETLRKRPIVGFRYKLIDDTWLERNVWLSVRKRGVVRAFRREIFDEVMFDPDLGCFEDLDLLLRLRKIGVLGDEIKVVDAEAGLHEPHTLKEYSLHEFWHGKTVWPYIRKYPRSFLSALSTAGSFGLLFLSVVAVFIDFRVSIMCIIPLAVTIAYLFMISPTKSVGRFVFLIFRLTYGSFIRAIGVLKGLYDYAKNPTNKSGTDTSMERKSSVLQQLKGSEWRSLYTWKHCKYIRESFMKFLPPNSVILDFGCGDGTRLRHFLTKGKNWHGIGIDTSRKEIQKALEATNKTLRQRIEFIISDVHYVPIKENTFDGAFVINVFHHLSGLSSTGELHRVIKEDGKLLVIDKPMLNPVMFLGRKMAGIVNLSRLVGWGDGSYFLFFSPGMLERALSKGGFKLLDKRCACYFPLIRFFISCLRQPYRAYASILLYRIDKFIEKIPLLKRLGMSVAFLCVNSRV